MVAIRLTRVALFFSDLDAILGDVIAMCNKFASINFLHVKRDENIVAYNIFSF